MNIEDLKAKAKDFSQYYNDSEALFGFINSIPNERLDSLRSKYKPNPKSIQPINLLRYTVVNLLLKEQEISAEDLEDIKSSLEQRDLSSFDFFTKEEINGLNRYPERKKSFYSNWSRPASILHPFFIDDDVSEEAQKTMKEIADEVISALELSDVKFHYVDFKGPQNYGNERIWGAIYPEHKTDHRQAHQLFFEINKDGLEGGLYSGSQIPEDDKINKRQKFNSVSELISRFKELKDEWVSSNKHYKEVKYKDTSFDPAQIELNQILYGPPGTGKTYNTINASVSIVEELSADEFKEKYGDDREKLRKAYKEYRKKGRIGFCTFHQSFTYEDFIEGIKPKMENEENDEQEVDKLLYEIKDGIFKIMAKNADSFKEYNVSETQGILQLADSEFEKANFFKISLGNSQDSDDNVIYDYCIENNCISIGWGDNYDYTEAKNEKEIAEIAEQNNIDIPNTRTFLSYFKLYLEVDDYVIIANGNYNIRAIGKVTGDYYYKKESPIRYHHFREVDWLFTNKDIPVSEFYARNLMQKTIYQFFKKDLKKEFFTEKSVKQIKDHEKELKRNHVLIVDEINRGNISQIFGELITLIEKDKRKGQDEELTSKLPYSKKEFSVPSNLYIVGTMNTADRSIEALDTALRRRFTFKEMPPKPHLLDEDGPEAINLQKMLLTINNRIEKLIDKDHKIGHSYFMNVSTLDELRISFRDKLIPLLQEYFYGDFGKIGLVLGEKFIENVKTSKDFSFAKFDGYDQDVVQDLADRKVYKFKNPADWNADTFVSIYN